MARKMKIHSRNRNRNKTRKGGAWYDFSNITGFFSPKKSASTSYQPQLSYPEPPSYQESISYKESPFNQELPFNNNGGKRRTRRMRGGFEPNTTSSSIANYASQFNGNNTAKPQTIVGGSSRKKSKTKTQHRHKRRM